MADKEAKKVKRPTAQKRDLQNEKRRLNNKMYKSHVRTAIRALNDSLTKGDPAEISEKLNKTYSVLDKCVQKGVYKRNKASRTKSRLAARALATK